MLGRGALRIGVYCAMILMLMMCYAPIPLLADEFELPIVPVDGQLDATDSGGTFGEDSSTEEKRKKSISQESGKNSSAKEKSKSSLSQETGITDDSLEVIIYDSSGAENSIQDIHVEQGEKQDQKRDNSNNKKEKMNISSEKDEETSSSVDIGITDTDKHKNEETNTEKINIEKVNAEKTNSEEIKTGKVNAEEGNIEKDKTEIVNIRTESAESENTGIANDETANIGMTNAGIINNKAANEEIANNDPEQEQEGSGIKTIGKLNDVDKKILQSKNDVRENVRATEEIGRIDRDMTVAADKDNSKTIAVLSVLFLIVAIVGVSKRKWIK